MADEQRLVITDFETTGLEAWQGDEILEMGVIVTTLDLEVVWEGEGLVQATPAGVARLRANAYVQEMHRKSGLLQDLAEPPAPMTVEYHDTLLAAALTKACPDIEPGQFLLAGSGTASFDRQFINKYLPEVRSLLHYSGGIDIGVVRRALRVLWHPDRVPVVPASSGPEKVHRALPDARAHLEELRAFKAMFSEVEESLFRLSDLLS